MQADEYRKKGKELVDYIADYLETIRDRRVYPPVKPGYLREKVPENAPFEPESWDNIFSDFEQLIMPGITHWQSPHMHAYFPALNSYPSLLGDMLADAINAIGFTWAASPACTELEIVVMNWLGQMVGLPDDFLHLRRDSPGGGVLQTTASESTMIALLAGRTEAIQRNKDIYPDLDVSAINSRLVAYTSDQAHSSIEKAGLIGLVKMRYIESDVNLSLPGDRLLEAVRQDREDGLIPFFLCATLGTTGACAFDNLEEIGPICKDELLWLHVDAAYAGTAFICPEFRKWLKGVHFADSFAFNPSKWMLVHFDCTAMWVKNSEALHRTFNVQPLYLQHENSGLAIDYMHWQIPLSKRFRSLKLWCVIRNYGVKGLQEHVRKGVQLAQLFEELVCSDSRFEIPAKRHLGLVVFRLKGDNGLTEKLLKRMNSAGKIHCVPAALKDKYVIRFTVTSARTTETDIKKDWAEIQRTASIVLSEMSATPVIATGTDDRRRIYLKDIYKRSDTFGSSLLLANASLSPKIVNGSFAAMLDEESNRELGETFNFEQLQTAHKDSLGKLLLGAPLGKSVGDRIWSAHLGYPFGEAALDHVGRGVTGESSSAGKGSGTSERISSNLVSVAPPAAVFSSSSQIGRHFSLDSRMDLVHAEVLRNLVTGLTTELDDSESRGLQDKVQHSYENLLIQSPLSTSSCDGFTESDFGSNATLATDDLDDDSVISQTTCQKCGHQIIGCTQK